ncbi:hypothetical protein XU18_2729 [Perkinsela sp. CCAP 1560/4]|nr:hypothetical protein XU18_2729 [Perkinsela sp. CCAP 1560/4]|eukprot:KNH06224.1 hypothetical protein XU18_2729 [Perkinsela sp. CCAP 1560/4]
MLSVSAFHWTGKAASRAPHSHHAVGALSLTSKRWYPRQARVPKRSSYQYTAAEGGDTGSRNESAFIPYQTFTPAFWDIKKRLGMTSLNNVLTMPLFDCAVILGSCCVISFFVWELWCRRHYQFIDIPRPPKQKESDE